jgi:hypothetical protein
MARFEINFLDNYSAEALLGELRRIAALIPEGKSLTKTVYARHSPKVSHSTIRRRFGGWKEALERAGLGRLYVGQIVSQKMRSQPAKSLSRADMISELKRVHALVGTEWLTTNDFNVLSVTSETAIRLRFGTFRKGLDAAGIPSHPLSAEQFTDQECFENIAEVWTQFGRQPQFREMFRAPSRIQGKTYVTRWGTWRKTLKAFAEWANVDGDALGSNEPEASSSVVHEPTKRAEKAQADCRDVRPGLRFKVFMRDRFRCVACGRSPAAHLNVELHADHILAVANGGKTTLENLQALCQDCNLGKGRSVVS